MAMKRNMTILLLFVLLVITPILISSCGAVGAEIRLEGLSLGTVAMEGKPLNGLPSDKINISLDVATQTVKVLARADGTVLTLVPSGATIEINNGNVSFKGFKPEQVKIEWAATE